MRIKKFDAEKKNFFDKFTGFFYLAIFPWQHLVIDSWKCIPCEINSSYRETNL